MSNYNNNNGDDSEERGGRGGSRFGGSRRARSCSFCAEKVKHVDYKDTDVLRRFLTDAGKIRPRRQTGTCARHQRSLRTAVLRARFMALVPYTSNLSRSSE